MRRLFKAIRKNYYLRTVLRIGIPMTSCFVVLMLLIEFGIEVIMYAYAIGLLIRGIQ